MTKAEQIKDAMGDCGMAAADCKGNADYAAYSFDHDNEADGREHVRRLEENFSSLKSKIRWLDHVKAKPE